MWLTDNLTAATVLAWIDDNEITLSISCDSLRFTGIWGQAPGLTQRFHGFLESQGPVVLTMLTVQRTEGGLLFSYWMPWVSQ